MKNVKPTNAAHHSSIIAESEKALPTWFYSGTQSLQFGIITLILIISTSIKAQFPDTLMKVTDTSFFQITSKVDTYLNNLDDTSFTLIGASDEDGWIPNYYRWKHFWQNRVDENGMFETAYKKMLNIVNGVWSSCNYSNLDEDKQWKCLGPFNSEGTHSEQDQNQGQVTAISVNASNSSDILVGTSGGVFRSINGGVSWANTTDDEGYSVFTITSFARHPLNQNIIYATTGTGVAPWNMNKDDYGRNYGIGLIVSQDGGITWYKSNVDISPPLEYFDRTCTKVLIDPTSTLGNTKLYMMQNMKIYKMNGLAYCNNYLSVWSDMTTPDDTSGVLWGWTYDLYGLGGRQRSYNDMEIESNGTLWFSNIEGLYKYDPGTTSTTKVTNYIPASVLTGSITCAISGGPVTKANPVYHSIYGYQ